MWEYLSNTFEFIMQHDKFEGVTEIFPHALAEQEAGFNLYLQHLILLMQV